MGRLAQEQRQWPQAEQYYQQALAIKVEFNDRYSQGLSYHQLGIVAQAQRRWPQARENLLKDLTITGENNDEHRLGTTLRSLARLWELGGDPGLSASVASVLGIDLGQAEELLSRHLPDE